MHAHVTAVGTNYYLTIAKSSHLKLNQTTFANVYKDVVHCNLYIDILYI